MRKSAFDATHDLVAAVSDAQVGIHGIVEPVQLLTTSGVLFEQTNIERRALSQSLILVLVKDTSDHVSLQPYTNLSDSSRYKFPLFPHVPTA